ncbi:MAG: hypothetical protein CMJ83_22235 [Planctomycetes bacterium]|nr:hypothetical protein [Planctomycetota bacterium]
MEASPLDALLNEDQAMIAQAVGELARDVVAPQHEHLDHDGTHPEELWGQIAELGLFGVFIPEDLGGAGAGFLAHAVAIETLARAAGVAGALACAQGVVVDALLRSGDERATEHLEGLATGETLGAPAMLEDDYGCKCVATGDSGDVTLSGTKTVVPFPGRAGCYLVRARRGTEDVLCLVPANAAGMAHDGPEENLGLHGFETGTLRLVDAPGVVLGGADVVAEVMTNTRIATAALFCGLGRGALDHAVRYSEERKQFKLELRRFLAIQERLVRSDTAVEAARGLVHGAARARDAGAACAQAARRARRFAGDVAVRAGDDAVQVYGGYGYSREYPAERFYRDARWCGFGEYWPAGVLQESMAALD